MRNFAGFLPCGKKWPEQAGQICLTSGMKWLSTLFFAALLAWGCQSETAPADAGPVAEAHPGKEAFEQYCQSCHRLPDISLLDQKTWKQTILVRMGAYMGIFNDNVRYYDSLPAKWLEPGEGGQRVLAAGVYPKKPMLSRVEFDRLKDYVLGKAPAQTQGPQGAGPISRDLAQFKARPFWRDTVLQPFVTGIHIVPGKNRVYAGLLKQSLLMLDGKGNLLDSMSGYTMPVHIVEDASGLRVTDLGSMGGSDNPQGKVHQATDFQSLKRGKGKPRFNFLHRPTSAHYLDLNMDGRKDLLVTEFGYHLGELVWHERVDRGWHPHVLFPDDGAVAAVVHDFTEDGLPDMAVLMANSDERLVLYVNEGNGNFAEKRLFRFDPSYGGAALELVDVDGDGRQDLVVANGDNGDYPPILKPHHGIRVYRHLGGTEFKEWVYLPMNGAYGTQTRDFDGDGDQDIAAVSFYPDYKGRPEEAFIYFEQTAPREFVARTFPEVGLSRWMVMDAGDVDGDGDEDLLLGGFNVKSDDASEATYQQWMQNNVPLMLLENQRF